MISETLTEELDGDFICTIEETANSTFYGSCRENAAFHLEHRYLENGEVPWWASKVGLFKEPLQLPELVISAAFVQIWKRSEERKRRKALHCKNGTRMDRLTILGKCEITLEKETETQFCQKWTQKCLIKTSELQKAVLDCFPSMTSLLFCYHMYKSTPFPSIKLETILYSQICMLKSSSVKQFWGRNPSYI